MNIIIPLAEGFEEIEGITIIDVLRRADLPVTSAAVRINPVTGSHGISVKTDRLLADLVQDDYDCIVLPGGMPGSENLKNSPIVISWIRNIFSRNGITAALCAAPMVLGHAGILNGKRATCYPGFENEMTGSVPTGATVEVDGRIITGRGPGCALPFALELAGILRGREVKSQLIRAMQVYWMHEESIG